jgi:hypothetical protein
MWPDEIAHGVVSLFSQVEIDRLPSGAVLYGQLLAAIGAPGWSVTATGA